MRTVRSYRPSWSRNRKRSQRRPPTEYKLPIQSPTTSRTSISAAEHLTRAPTARDSQAARSATAPSLRGPQRGRVYEADGTFVPAWGEGVFVRPHGLFIGPGDTVYCTDDFGHAVRAFTPEGRLLLTLGTPGQPSDTGATSIDYRTI